MKRTKNTITLSDAERDTLAQAADILSLIHRNLVRNELSHCEDDCISCDYLSLEESINTLDFFFDHPTVTLL